MKKTKKIKAKPITAAGGVLFRNRNGAREVCLIKRLGVWDLPKGKLEKGESIERCAVREVEEELGISGVKLLVPLIRTNHSYEDKYGLWAKTTHWFLMEAPDQPITVQTEEAIEKAEWAEINKAVSMVAYENLVAVLLTVQNHK